MSQNPFAPANAGELSPFVRSLNTVNSALEVLRNIKNPYGQFTPDQGEGVNQHLPVPHSSVLVRNDTGASLAALSVLKLGETLQDIETQPHDTFRLPAFEGTTPAAASDQFCVLLEGAESNGVAQAAIRGVAVCYVNIVSTSDLWAMPDGGSSAQLVSGDSGPARILTTPTGTGRQLCAVLIDDRGDRLVRVVSDETTINGDPATTLTIYSADEPTTSTPAVQFIVQNDDGAGTPQPKITLNVFPQGTGSTVAQSVVYTSVGGTTTQIQTTWNLNSQSATWTTTESNGDLIHTFSSGQQFNFSSAAGLPSWTKVTKTYLQLAAASTTNNIAIHSLPAKGVVHAVAIKHTTAFGGGGITAYTVSVGTAGSSTKYSNHATGSSLDVFSAVSNTNFLIGGAANGFFNMENFGAATDLHIHATSTTANLDQATAGSVDIYILASTLP